MAKNSFVGEATLKYFTLQDFWNLFFFFKFIKDVVKI